MSRDDSGSVLGPIALGIFILLGCLLIYLAWEHWTDSTFDADRYQLVKVGPDGTPSYSVWKFDKRTGYIELCSHYEDATGRRLVCIQPLMSESKARAPIASSNHSDSEAPAATSSSSTVTTTPKE